MKSTCTAPAPPIRAPLTSCASASLRNYVDERRLAALDYVDRLFQYRAKILGVGDRTERCDTEPLGHRRVIYERIIQSAADVGSVDATLSAICHPLQAHHLLMIGAVVV